MIHYIALFHLEESVDEAATDAIIRASRSQLLKCPEVLSIRSGKRVDLACEWPFFLALDFENLDKLEMFKSDPHYIKFQQEILRGKTTDHLELIYETEPGKDVRYS